MSAETKHTPGPWRIAAAIPRHNKYYIHANDFSAKSEREMQVLVLDRGYHPDKQYNDRAEADAKLIAAAPELLQALIDVVRIADRKTVEFDRAKAAIEKATK